MNFLGFFFDSFKALPKGSNIVESNIVGRGGQTNATCLFTLKDKRNVGWCWRRCLIEIKLRSASSNIMQHHATLCNMLDLTMLDDVASTCWIRLTGPLKKCHWKIYEDKALCYTSQLKNVFRLEENVPRVVGQDFLTPLGRTKLSNSLGIRKTTWTFSHVIRS